MAEIKTRFIYETAVHAMRELTPSAKLIYTRLLNHCRNQKECFPSLKRLAFQTGLAKKTVCIALKSLAKAKLIQIENRWDKITGSNLSNIYRILTPPNLTDKPQEKACKGLPKDSAPNMEQEDPADQDQEYAGIDFSKMPEWKDKSKKIRWTKREWAKEQERIKTLRSIYIN